MWIRALIVASSFAALMMFSSVARARASGDPGAGLKLARQWCTGCHVVEPAGRGGDSGPPFLQIANRPSRTRASMEAWLTDPHPPMPNLSLSRREIEDVIAYIDTLQGRI
jgi:cytochrome c